MCVFGCRVGPEADQGPAMIRGWGRGRGDWILVRGGLHTMGSCNLIRCRSTIVD